MFGFLTAIPRGIGRGFKAIWGAFGNVFRSEMVKFIAKYERTFRQVILDVATGQLEGDRNKQMEAFARLILALKGIPKGFKDHWINFGIELVFAKLKTEGKV